MDLFGTQIELGTISGLQNSVDLALEKTLKRSDERQIFKKFLDLETTSGVKVIELVLQDADKKTDLIMESRGEIPDNQLQKFVMQKLKKRQVNGESLYEHIKRQTIEKKYPNFVKLHELIDSGKFDGELPYGYPSASKEADSLLIGKIKDSVNDETKRQYIKEKSVLEIVRSFSREMFYGINKLHLRGDELVTYLGLLFELSRIETDQMENSTLFRDQLKDAIVNDETLQFLIIKCLRFSYPQGNRIKIVTHTNREDIKDRFGGVFLKTDENMMFKNIGRFQRIFSKYGVDTQMLLVIADNDLVDNFPPSLDNAFPKSDLTQSKKDAEKYMDFLRKKSGEVEVMGVIKFMEEMGVYKRYEEVREKVLQSLNKGDGKYLPEKMIENLVEHRFERDSAIFETSSRQIARDRVYQKMASQLAMRVFAVGSKVLVTNSHGGENKYIADGMIPVLFTDFYSEEKVFENV